MSQELIYTSAPTGLKPGSKGFCTVAITAGLPASWIERLELLSAYRPVYPLGDPKSNHNPINFSHWRMTVAGKSKSVLSRVAFAGADYSMRSNKLAHHIMLEPAEQAAGGPAWMMLKSGVMWTTWTGTPQQIPAGPKLPAGDRAASVCATWASVRGNAGWAGVLAEAFMTEPAKPAYLMYAPGTDILRLFDESLSLLPPAKRWEVTFSTFFTELPLNLSCAWRAVVAGTPAATEAMRLGPRALVLDLTKPPAAPPSGKYADAACAGSGSVVANIAPKVAAVSNKPAIVTAPPIDPEDSGITDVFFQKEPTTDSPVVRGRRTLTTAAISDGLESAIPMGVLVEDENETPVPRQIVVHRGVRGWIFTASTLGCLLLGVAGSALTYKVMLKRIRSRENAVALADQKLGDANAKLSDAKAEHEKAESTASKADDERADALRITTANRSLIDGLKHDNATLTTSIRDLSADRIRLSAKLSDAENRENVAKGELDKSQKALEQVKAASQQNGGAASDQGGNGQPSANAIPINDNATKMTFPESTAGDDSRFDLALPAACTNPSGLSIQWPDGGKEFSVTAANKARYKLSLKVINPTKLSIQTLLPSGTDMAVKEIFSVEISANRLIVVEKKSDNASTNAAEAAAQAALEDSAFLITAKSGDKDTTFRYSLNRSRKPVVCDAEKDIFSRPDLPPMVRNEDIRFDGTSQGWGPSQDGTSGLFTCQLSQTQQAQFQVTFSISSDKLCQLKVDVDAFKSLKAQRTRAVTQKEEAESAATTADGKLTKAQGKHEGPDAISRARDAKDAADADKKTKEGEADRLDKLVNDWSNKYGALNHVFPLSIRLPNGVEVMHMHIGLPPCTP